jgi:hypothetical protein
MMKKLLVVATAACVGLGGLAAAKDAGASYLVDWNGTPGLSVVFTETTSAILNNARDTAIGEDFTWLGATHDYVSGIVQLTWDRTAVMAAAPAPVPLPTSVFLLGSGVLGLLGVRRKRG